MRALAVLLLAALFPLLFAACKDHTVLSYNQPCARHADCVPADCCHPDWCVNIENAPECDGVTCTDDCVPETLDCGGVCYCEGGRCAAYWKNF